jgi:carbamate kinase
MKIVVALGGNALLRRGQALSADNQLDNIRRVAAPLARLAAAHTLLLTHGNGPQVGLLALQSASGAASESYPLDVLGAQTEGMIGYLLEQELANLLPPGRAVVSLLTRVEVDAQDPAFARPSKPIGPVYPRDEGLRLAGQRGWPMVADGDGLRRVVASPQPIRVLGVQAMGWLLGHGAVVIAAGGGGIPVARGADGRTLHGVEAVIDKDLCSGLLARELAAEVLIIATDVDAVYVDWGRPGQHALRQVTPDELEAQSFPPGTMGPKVAAACAFARATGERAVIGSLECIEQMLQGQAGTEVRVAAPARA